MFFKQGQIKEQIHTFNCIHCNGVIEALERDPGVNVNASADCPHCGKKITYSFIQKECWDYKEYKNRGKKTNPFKQVLLINKISVGDQSGKR